MTPNPARGEVTAEQTERLLGAEHVELGGESAPSPPLEDRPLSSA